MSPLVADALEERHAQQIRSDERRRGWLKRRRMTVCLRGHAFDKANTYVCPDGKRRCRACRNLRQRWGCR